MDCKTKVNLMLIASGSGTDAFSIMNAWKQGWIPEIDQIVLVSTHAGAGCLEKATSCGVESVTLVPPSIPLRSQDDRNLYHNELLRVVGKYDVQIVFLVGCVLVIPLIGGVSMYNIHPADIYLHGGDGMYSLRPHEHVLSAALDEIRRGKKVLGQDRFFTYPTVHELDVIPDAGLPLLRGSVEIPDYLLTGIQNDTYSLKEAAKKLQQIVLPYEWMILPTAVRMAVARILT